MLDFTHLEPVSHHEGGPEAPAHRNPSKMAALIEVS